MPRQARLDIVGILQHVMVRGIERRDIFVDDRDRLAFLERLSRLLIKTGTDCLAWSLLTNQVHLLLRPTKGKLSEMMRRLLTGYAVFVECHDIANSFRCHDINNSSYLQLEHTADLEAVLEL